VAAWAVLQHVDFEGPGVIAAEARLRGIELRARRIDRGERVPDTEEVDGLIVMGGPMSLWEVEEHPWLAAERRALAAAVAYGLPVLGVCLGAQLVAAALGARVFRGPEPEVGAGRVELTEEGRRDPVLSAAGPSLPVLHWHGDTFDLPHGAVHLARSDRYANQAFRFGDRVLALQFHLEVDRALAEAMRPHLPFGSRLGEDHRADIERAGRRVLGAFLDSVAG
jgi:GMP synthase-like glutamine amidotransferase